MSGDFVILPDVNQRIKNIIESNHNGSVRAFAKALGLTDSQKINRLFNLDARNRKYPKPSIDVLTLISNVFDISLEWLQTGEGEMRKNENVEMAIGRRDMNGYRMVPVYNFDAVAGMHTSNDVVDTVAYVEKYIPFAGAAQDDICLNVWGNSMMPTYSSGSLLLIREVEGWKEYFGYGHCYVLFLKDGRRILKEVQKSETDHQKYVLCVSYNPQNPPEELPRDFIHRVFKVIRTLTNEGF